MQEGTGLGAVDGGARTLLRAEGLLLLLAAVALYVRANGDWKTFFALFLIPDVSFFGYLGGPRTGALAYNTMHSTILPLILAAVGITQNLAILVMLALIWLAHVGFDRALGYGLKHGRGFGFTHLGRIGRTAEES